MGPDLYLAETHFVAWRENPLRYIIIIIIVIVIVIVIIIIIFIIIIIIIVIKGVKGTLVWVNRTCKG